MARQRPIALILLASTLCLPASRSAAAQEGEEPISTTRHTVTVGGRPLRYTARAGRLAIRHNETGEVRGQMFFVSYTLDRAPGQRERPLTFVWNGGPGSNAALTHLVGFGPRRMVPPKQGVQGAKWTLEDNPGTWLDESDLVFVDPIGTGYSRPTRSEYGADFYSDRGDAESVGEFIRVYRTRFDAFDAPLFLAGESFGVGRASRVAAVLQARGIEVRGAILIGLAAPLGALTPAQRTALGLPTFTAAGYHHRKLPADLQGDLQATLRLAEQWAEQEYAPALARRDSLGDAEREAIVRGLARFTGLDAALVDRRTLTINRMQLGNYLLRREGRFVGQYDSRVTGALDTAQAMYDPTKDPSLDDLLDGVLVLRYLRNELGYRNDLQYQGPFGGGYPAATSFRGDWMSMKWSRPAPAAAPASQGGQPAPGPPRAPGATATVSPLQSVMSSNPRLRVLVGCGIYDLVCDYHGNAFAVRTLPPGLRERVTSKGYGGGHAMYTDPLVHPVYKQDVVQFYREALAATRGR